MKSIACLTSSEGGFYNPAPVFMSDKDAVLEALRVELESPSAVYHAAAVDSMINWLESPHDHNVEAVQPNACHRCGETDFSPSIEAFEICGELTCEDCAEEVFEENDQFGAGA